MEEDSQTFKIKFHNGLKEIIKSEQLIEFDYNSIMKRFFHSRDLDTSKMLEQLGDWILDFTNVHDWRKEIPDIDTRSARIFSLWAEDLRTGKIIGLVRGFFTLLPYGADKTTLQDYYTFHEELPYYPWAVICALRTIVSENKEMDMLLGQMREAISLNWSKVRQNTIKRLSKGSSLWKRYVYSFSEVIHFTILCPSFDREMIDALTRKDYNLTGIMQIYSSPSSSYDDITLKHHLRSAKKIMDQSHLTELN
jgi:hypothetical protein